jgi:hypothetical protein
MVRYAIISFVLVAYASCFASDTLDGGRSYNIADYHPQRFHEQSLQISPDLNFQTNVQEDSSNGAGDLSNRNSTGGNVSCYGSHKYRDFSVFRDLELSTWGSFDGNLQNVEQNGVNPGSSESTRYPGFSYSLSNTTRYRLYMPFNLFIEGELFPNISNTPYGKSEDRRYQISDAGYDSMNMHMSRYTISKSSSSNVSLSLNSGFDLSVGKGWVADVTAAAVALQMIDRIGALCGERPRLTHTQMDSLAWLLDRFRRKRFFDSRINDIETTDTLCQYLLDKKILPKETVRMAMEVRDIRAYGFNQSRYSGMEIKVSPIAQVYFDRSDNHTSTMAMDSTGPFDPAIHQNDLSSWPLPPSVTHENYMSNFTYSYGLTVSGDFSRPIGRDFEVDGALEMSGVMISRSDSSYTTSYDSSYSKGTYPNARMNISAGCNWYPSIRSTISFTSEYSFSKDFNYRTLTYRGIGYMPSMNLWQGTFAENDFTSALNVSYYVSPQCAYSVRASLQFNQGKNRSLSGPYYYMADRWNVRSWSFGVGANLTYAIF